MIVKDRLKKFIAYKGLSVREFERLCEFPNGTISAINDSISPSRKEKIVEKFPELDVAWLLTGFGEMIFHEDPKINPTKDDALKELERIRSKKKLPEGKLLKDSSLVEAIQYVVPIKGQAGLKKAFFTPDEYIDQNFVKETILVKPSERSVYYRIEADGNSMPGIIDPGDWARCEDIHKLYWLEKGTFKKERVYCLIHRTRGILFKRIINAHLDTITLSSDNTDKDEYPDETFDLAEFSKILRVTVVEKRL